MGLLVHNLPNSHNNLWAKWVPILEGQAHIPVSVAQINSHLHPLPQTNKQTKKPGQEIVKREKKGEKAKLDVQDACVMWKRGTRAAHRLTRKYTPNLQSAFSYPTSIAPLLMTDLTPEARTARKQLSNITVTDKEASQKEGRIVRNSISGSHWPVTQLINRLEKGPEFWDQPVGLQEAVWGPLWYRPLDTSVTV